MIPQTNEPAFSPNYYELGLLVLTSVIHILIETVHPLARFKIINILAIAGWAGHVVWKVVKTKGILNYWGFRWDNFWVAFRSCLYFTIPAIILIFGYGFFAHHFPIPSTFWMICVLYPIWGIVQQFALQGLVQRNIRDMIKPILFRSVVLAILFSSAHAFDMRLVLLAFPIGFAFSWIYYRSPNLLALEICHGILGAMVYYFVLGQDPGTEIINLLMHRK